MEATCARAVGSHLLCHTSPPHTFPHPHHHQDRRQGQHIHCKHHHNVARPRLARQARSERTTRVPSCCSLSQVHRTLRAARAHTRPPLQEHVELGHARNAPTHTLHRVATTTSPQTLHCSSQTSWPCSPSGSSAARTHTLALGSKPAHRLRTAAPR